MINKFKVVETQILLDGSLLYITLKNKNEEFKCCLPNSKDLKYIKKEIKRRYKESKLDENGYWLIGKTINV